MLDEETLAQHRRARNGYAIDWTAALPFAALLALPMLLLALLIAGIAGWL